LDVLRVDPVEPHLVSRVTAEPHADGILATAAAEAMREVTVGRPRTGRDRRRREQQPELQETQPRRSSHAIAGMTGIWGRCGSRLTADGGPLAPGSTRDAVSWGSSPGWLDVGAVFRVVVVWPIRTNGRNNQRPCARLLPKGG
jgi:hypothetical protein